MVSTRATLMRRVALGLVLALLAAPAAGQQVWLAGGLSSSVGFGEDAFAPAAHATAAGLVRGLEVESTSAWNGARKYTGAGYSLGQALDFAARPVGPVGVLVGADYRYRNGGPWSKHALWLRSGLVWSRQGWTLKAVLRVPLWDLDPPAVRLAQWEVRRRLSPRWRLALTQGVGTYRQPRREWGAWSEVSLGYRLK